MDRQKGRNPLRRTGREPGLCRTLGGPEGGLLVWGLVEMVCGGTGSLVSSEMILWRLNPSGCLSSIKTANVSADLKED